MMMKESIKYNISNDIQLIFEMFCSREKDRLKRNIESVDENIKKKYEVENGLFKEFINNFPKNGLLY